MHPVEPERNKMASGVEKETGSIRSEILDREMEFFWFGTSGRPVVLFPTSAGRHNENVDFGIVGALDKLLADGAIQVCSMDSINRDSWAADGVGPEEKLRLHGLYDRFLAEEFFPHVADRTGREDPVVYGASLGGWQAATFAARHPEQVARVIAFSGFFDIRQLVEDWWSEDCYFFSPQDFIPNMDKGHHVGALHHLARHLEARRGLEVEGDAALVAPRAQVVDALAVDELVAYRPVALEGADQGLDGDDVGAQVAEDLGARRADEKVVEANDLGSRE